jgi:gluconate 2-dehydrogenase gamma chain
MELGRMDRRALLARAMLLVGASVAASACATLEPLAAATPATMTPARLATLTAVADTMIPRTDTPGALDVEVPGLFSALMDNWAAPETRAMLMQLLDRIERLPGNGRSFTALAPAERKAVLIPFDTAALAPSGAQGSPFGAPPATDPAYQRLKQLILTLYYLSQPALTQELAYTHVPGRWDPSIPVTPATRPQGGPGMF